MAASDPGLCVLRMPESINAFRFVYPTLIVAAHDRVFLWDVPSGKLIQTLYGCQSIGSEGLWLRRSILNTWRTSQNTFLRMKLDCINNLGRRIDPILKEILILESKIGKVPTLHQVFFY